MDAAAEDQRVVDDLASHGVAVEHVRTICVPRDETCFSLFGAPSAVVVKAAFQRVGVHIDRITEAVAHSWPDGGTDGQ